MKTLLALVLCAAAVLCAATALGASVIYYDIVRQTDHPLLTLDNVVASVHAGGNTKDNDINMVNYIYANIVAFDREEPLARPCGFPPGSQPNGSLDGEATF